MELNIRQSFLRDWQNISSRQLNKEIETTTYKIKKATSISGIFRMKKLIGSANQYKIEIRVQKKIYWILCQRFGNRIDFFRIKSEDWCKKNLKD